MKAWKLAVAAPILVACDAIPTEPARAPVAATDVEARMTETTPPPLLILTAPGQIVTLERESGETERAWVQAHLVVPDLSGRGGTAQMDGAILVVSAADGPMPQTSPTATWLKIKINAGTVGSDGVIRFSGIASLGDASGERTTFDIAGSARPHAADDPYPLIWDIVGGDEYDGATFETEGVLIDRAQILTGG
jgi:hypothetical protein